MQKPTLRPGSNVHLDPRPQADPVTYLASTRRNNAGSHPKQRTFTTKYRLRGRSLHPPYPSHLTLSVPGA